MAYTINKWNGSALTVVRDGEVSNIVDLPMIGRNYVGYGEYQNESFLHLLENFAGPEAPSKAVAGQLWYDSLEKKLRIHNGSTIGGVKVWKSLTNAEVKEDEPDDPSDGDIWFNTTTNQFMVYYQTQWTMVGPQSAGFGITQMVSKVVNGYGVDEAGNRSENLSEFSIIAATINDEVTHIISKSEFYLNDRFPDGIPGFYYIRMGITLKEATENKGNSTANGQYLWGTASHALSADRVKDRDISIEPVPDTIPLRNLTADIYANKFYGNLNGDLLGTPHAPHPPRGVRDTRVATTMFVHRAVEDYIARVEVLGEVEAKPNTLVSRDDNACIFARRFYGNLVGNLGYQDPVTTEWSPPPRRLEPFTDFNLSDNQVATTHFVWKAIEIQAQQGATDRGRRYFYSGF